VTRPPATLGRVVAWYARVVRTRGVCSLFLAATVGCSFDPGGVLLPPEAPSTGFFRTLSFDNAVGEESLEAVPALVALTPERIDYGLARADGRDLLFTDAEGTPVPHELERWEPGGTSFVWVLVPSIPAGSTGEILWMFYGDPDRTVAEDPEAVWRDSYELVYHFGESSDIVLNSARPSRYQGTVTGTSPVEGRVGGGSRFEVGGEHLIVVADSEDLFSGWEEFTVEAWVYPDYDLTADVASGRFLDRGGPVRNGRVHVSGATAGKVQYQIDFHFEDHGQEANRLNQLDRQAWTYAVYAYGGEPGLRKYKNAQAENPGSVAAGDRLQESSDPLVLGHSSEGLQGVLDEIRISQRGHTTAWIDLQHRSMTDTLIVFGPQGAL
jgi:hypothetical protein